MRRPGLDQPLVHQVRHLEHGLVAHPAHAGLRRAQVGQQTGHAPGNGLDRGHHLAQALLDALPNRNAYLAPTLLAWAQGKPADPEAPKALHFFVPSTRNECRPPVPANGQPAPEPTYSRDAFRLLHKLWPDSDWARTTRYHYGGR